MKTNYSYPQSHGANDNDSAAPLCIGTFEGGGRLGLITAYVVDQLVENASMPFHDIFDEVYGVSINAVLVASLWPLRDTGTSIFTPDKYKNYFEDHGDDLLQHPWLFHRLVHKFTGVTTSYNVDGLEAMIHEKFQDLKLSDFADGLNIYVWDITKHRKSFLSSDTARQDPSQDFYMRDLLRAAISFPTAIKTKPIKNQNGSLVHFFDMASFGTCPSFMGVERTQQKYGSDRPIIPIIFGCGRLNLDESVGKILEDGIIGTNDLVSFANTTEVTEDRRRVAKICPDNFLFDITLDGEANTFSPLKDVIPNAIRALKENNNEINKAAAFICKLRAKNSAAQPSAPDIAKTVNL